MWLIKKKFDSLKEVERVGRKYRNHGNLHRKMMKTMEEVGELSEALMGVTSKTNYKNKTWEDVLEESVDVVLMGLDIALTIPPGECSLAEDNEELRREKVEDMFRKKLKAWEEKASSQQTALGE